MRIHAEISVPLGPESGPADPGPVHPPPQTGALPSGPKRPPDIANSGRERAPSAPVRRSFRPLDAHAAVFPSLAGLVNGDDGDHEAHDPVQSGATPYGCMQRARLAQKVPNLRQVPQRPAPLAALITSGFTLRGPSNRFTRLSLFKGGSAHPGDRPAISYLRIVTGGFMITRAPGPSAPSQRRVFVGSSRLSRSRCHSRSGPAPIGRSIGAPAPQ